MGIHDSGHFPTFDALDEDEDEDEDEDALGEENLN